MIRLIALILGMLLGLPIPLAAAEKDVTPLSSPVVGLLQWVGDDSKFEYRLELLPILVSESGKFSEAQKIRCADGVSAPALAVGQEYGVYRDGQLVGRFTVRKTIQSVRSCCSVAVGLGDIKLVDADRGHLPVNQSLIAVSPPVVDPWRTFRLWRDVGLDADEFTERVMPKLGKLIDDYLRENGIRAIPNEPPAIDLRSLHRITRSGDPAALIRVRRPLQSDAGDVDPNRRPTVKLAAWFSLKHPDSPVLLTHQIYKNPGFDADGGDWQDFVLIDLLDLNGDGTSELIYRVDAYENHFFRVYSVARPKPGLVFEGGAYGC